jgi:hypothetical protein
LPEADAIHSMDRTDRWQEKKRRFMPMHLMKTVLLTTALSILTSFAQAQKTVLHTNMQWFQYNTRTKLNDKLVLTADAGMRQRNALRELAMWQLRAGLGYPIGSGFQGTTGIGAFTSYNKGIRNRTEIRLYQDIVRSTDLWKTSVQHRLRIEARYFINRMETGAATPTNFNFRFRYRLYTQTPVTSISAKHPERKLMFNLGDEIMVNAGSQIKYNRFDNNRLLIGPGLDWNRDLNISLNYVHQFGHRNQPDTYEESNILWLNITQRIGFHPGHANTKNQMMDPH